MQRFKSGPVLRLPCSLSLRCAARAARVAAIGTPRTLALSAAAAALLFSGSQAAYAQSGTASAAAAQADPAALAEAAVKPPTVPAAQAGKLPLGAQVLWLRRAAQSGMLEALDDDALVALFTSLDPRTLSRYIAAGPNGYPSYEFTMLRQERLRGVFPDKPDHMLVRLTRDPLRIYVKWLPDGAHAGQELIYDSTLRSDEMYGHLGGILSVMPLWTSLNGALARAQSNHNVRELGTEFIAQQFLADSKKFETAGVERSQKIEVKTLAGVRVVAFTFESPTGRPEFYAKKETLGLDLRHPYFRSVESYDNDGRIFERIVFDSITPKALPDDTFDPKNPAYKF
ncbi:DUF1571 domain-containing protein [Trinickia violacea]|uniref:DUF1571 domain-containing protein n=1 Tax=Trinickia violacea TaxID=2571746 RepID=A0A4P8ISH4_9BURK|nr:DUF1571 domain-containing protein [Trinickia violacea]QCP49944.1 DUF1571 domain-containing protein [Trinickia violacea]